MSRSGAHDASTFNAHPLRLVSATLLTLPQRCCSCALRRNRGPAPSPCPSLHPGPLPCLSGHHSVVEDYARQHVLLQTSRLPLQPPQTQPGRKQSDYKHCCPKGPPVPRGSPSSLSQVEKVSLEKPLQVWVGGRVEAGKISHVLYAYYVPNMALLFYPPFSSKPLTTIPRKGHIYSSRSHPQISEREGCGLGPQPGWAPKKPAPVDCLELGSGLA